MQSLNSYTGLRFFLAAVATLGLAGAVGAADVPSVGDKAPAFEAKSLPGDSFEFNPVNADGPSVVVFLRGFPGYQCPICTRQIAGMVRKAGEFKNAGAKVTLIYPGPAQNLALRAKEFEGSKGLPDNFTMVLDPDYKITNLYNLRWDAANETAYPSTFVVDQTGKITYAKVSKSHGGRADVAEVLAAIAELAGAK